MISCSINKPFPPQSTYPQINANPNHPYISKDATCPIFLTPK